MAVCPPGSDFSSTSWAVIDMPLLYAMKRAGSVRGRLALCGLHADLRHVFRLTRLDQVFEIHESESEALTAFGV